jgi:hypothetical protein
VAHASALHGRRGGLAEARAASPGRDWPTPTAGFYATNRIDLIENRPLDGSHRPLLLAAVGRRIEAIIAQDGVFRVPKTFGYFVADL